ncbi:hypothetical protein YASMINEVIRUS_1526, partial [Yasminevirus sp. GU-2018]
LSLLEIYRVYTSYVGDPRYVYKLCSSRWIVILEKLPDTLCNEGRSNVIDMKYAKFRADKLLVVMIFEADKPTTKTQTITTQHKNIKTTYTVGKSVVPDFYDPRPNEVCSGGIHYFTTVDGAYYYRDPPNGYSGRWFAWNDAGKRMLDIDVSAESPFIDSSISDRLKNLSVKTTKYGDLVAIESNSVLTNTSTNTLINISTDPTSGQELKLSLEDNLSNYDTNNNSTREPDSNLIVFMKKRRILPRPTEEELTELRKISVKDKKKVSGHRQAKSDTVDLVGLTRD